MLKTLTQYGRDATVGAAGAVSGGTLPLPAQTFAYTEPASGYTSTDNSIGASYSFPSNWYATTFADVNGDGTTDAISGSIDLSTNTLRASAALITAAGWTRADAFAPPVALQDVRGADAGVRVADLNGDGLPDLIQGFRDAGVLGSMAWINSGGGCDGVSCAWTPAPQLAPPVAFAFDDHLTSNNRYVGYGDAGARLIDLNGDGRADIVYGFYGNGTSSRGALINTAAGWVPASGFTPPADFAGRDSSVPEGWAWDAGLRTVDLDGDGKLDLVQGWYNYGTSTRGAWLNGGSGWVWSTAYVPAVDFTGRDSSAPRGWDSGVRMIDLNADGRADLVQAWYNWGTSFRQAWLNSGTGWTRAATYDLPVEFTGRDSSAPAGWDNGVRIGDLNGDGKPDILRRFSHWFEGYVYYDPNDIFHSYPMYNGSTCTVYSGAWLNDASVCTATSSCQWISAPQYDVPTWTETLIWQPYTGQVICGPTFASRRLGTGYSYEGTAFLHDVNADGMIGTTIPSCPTRRGSSRRSTARRLSSTMPRAVCGRRRE